MAFSLDQLLNYAAYRQTKEGWDEAGGRSNAAVSEEQWNRMTPQQKLAHWGGGQLMVKPGDPGYDELTAHTRGQPGRNIFITLDPMGTAKPGDQEGYLVDPSREFKGDGFYAHSEDNQTPGFQHKDDDTWDYGKYLAVLAMIMGGGYAAGAFAPEAAGALGSTAGEVAAGTGAFDVSGVTPSLYGNGVGPYVPSGVEAYPGWATEGGLPPGGDVGLPPGTQPPAPVSEVPPPAGPPGSGPPGGTTGLGVPGASSVPWGQLARFLGGTAGASLLGGNGTPGGDVHKPGGQDQADNNWQNLTNQITRTATSQADLLTPYLRNAFGESSDLYRQLAGRMGGWGDTLDDRATGLFGGADRLRGVGDTLWDTASDPQGKLRASLLQGTQDKSRAATSMRGIGMSPQAAAMENEAVGNFDMNWEDRQLARQLEGSRGMAGLYDAAGRSDLAGTSDLGAAAGMFRGAGALPFDLSQLFSGAMGSGVYTPLSGVLGNLENYLGLGQTASNQGFNQGQTNLNNLTTLFGQLFGGNSKPGASSWGSLANFFGGNSGGTSWANDSAGPGWGIESGSY